MFINLDKLRANAKAYVKAHPPNTGYTLKVIDNIIAAVRSGVLPPGTNIMVQFILQFDGKETEHDLVHAFAERRLPYLGSWSLDKGADCADLTRNVNSIFFPELEDGNIGNWTESQWDSHVHYDDFGNMRPTDLPFWLSNTKKKAGRDASHTAMYVGNDDIFHTTSKGNPARVDRASYWSSNRIGYIRVLTDEQYESLIVPGGIIESEGEDMIVRGDKGTEVYLFQHASRKAGYVVLKEGKTWEDMKETDEKGKPIVNGCDGDFGPFMVEVTKRIQEKHQLDQTGDVDMVTYGCLVSEIDDTDELANALGEIKTLNDMFKIVEGKNKDQDELIKTAAGHVGEALKVLDA